MSDNSASSADTADTAASSTDTTSDVDNRTILIMMDMDTVTEGFFKFHKQAQDIENIQVMGIFTGESLQHDNETIDTVEYEKIINRDERGVPHGVRYSILWINERTT